MRVEHVEVLVEEPSMEAALRELLPKLLGDISFEVYAHQGKSDLLARLPGRLRGYASWLPESYRVVVLVDRDSQDCEDLKRSLETFAADAGLSTRSTVQNAPWRVLTRIAIEELEAWYFGDWAAVRTAYPNVRANIVTQVAYRDPDGVAGGTWEAFERVMQAAGYFAGGLAKIEAARTIAEHMNPSRSTSRSFCRLRDALREVTTG